MKKSLIYLALLAGTASAQPADLADYDPRSTAWNEPSLYWVAGSPG